MFKVLKVSLYSLFILVVFNAPNSIYAFDMGQFDEVKGYTVMDVTHAVGRFDGADYDKLIELDNGMIFRFSEYKYYYAYKPSVVVFGRIYSLDEVKKYVPSATSGLTSYKLLIDDDFYDVNRVK
jgi:hypothetical protein